MNKLNINDVWKPYHVILGNSITILPLTDGGVSEELKAAGVNNSNMRSKLMLSAAITSRAIVKMLASDA